MILKTPFTQAAKSLHLHNANRGICFRVSYKWASCKFRNEVFKFYGINWVKTYAKQMSYLQEPDALREDIRTFNLGNEIGYYGWVLGVHRNDEYYIDHWGKKHGGLKCRAHRVVNVEEFIIGTGEGQYFVYCYYGMTATGSPWGHAVAFAHRSSEGARFFDPNRGEYGFGGSENIGRAVDQHCDAYAGGGNRILDRYIYDLYT